MKNLKKALTFVCCLSIIAQATSITSNTLFTAFAADTKSATDTKTTDTDKITDVLPVTVTAMLKSGVTTIVPNATVELKNGNTVLRTAVTDNNGNVQFSLKGLTPKQIASATVSAYSTVSSREAITGSNRDKLFCNFPDNTRVTYELHSDTLDDHGNWIGVPIAQKRSEQADVVFVIDNTSSMSDTIKNVKSNVQAFAKEMFAKGIDIRFSIVQFGDMSEDCRKETEYYANRAITYANDRYTEYLKKVEDVKLCDKSDTETYKKLCNDRDIAYSGWISSVFYSVTGMHDTLVASRKYNIDYNKLFKDFDYDEMRKPIAEGQVYSKKQAECVEYLRKNDLIDDLFMDYYLYNGSYGATELVSMDGNVWFENADATAKAVDSIKLTGGGDGPESSLDALGFVAKNNMHWRSDANKFCYLITDAPAKYENSFGYKSFNKVAADLRKQGIIANVVDYKYNDYTPLKITHGVNVGTPDSAFVDNMNVLSKNIENTVKNKITLKLQEPRIKYNVSVSYLNEGINTDQIKSTMSYFSQSLAQATNGHAMIDKVLLVPAINEWDSFYGTNNPVAMADLQITTFPDSWTRIRANAHSDGFYSDSIISTIDDLADSGISGFDVNENYYKYQRIIMSGTEGAGWNNNIKDDSTTTVRGKTQRREYGETIAHEFAHYAFGVFDEYEDSWSGKYALDLGLMRSQHDKLEMSNNYIYNTYGYGGTDQTNYFGMPVEEYFINRLTNGFNQLYDAPNGNMIDIDPNMIYSNPFTAVYKNSDFRADTLHESSLGAVFNTEYADAKLKDSNFIMYEDKYTGPTVMYAPRMMSASASETVSKEAMNKIQISKQSFGTISSEDIDDNTIRLTIDKPEGDNPAIYIRKFGADSYTKYDLSNIKSEEKVLNSALDSTEPITEPETTTESVTETTTESITETTAETITEPTTEVTESVEEVVNTFMAPLSNATNNSISVDLPIEKGGLYEVRYVANIDGEDFYNGYYIDRSKNLEAGKGYYSEAPNNTVQSKLISNEGGSFTVITDVAAHHQGEYHSVNSATYISGNTADSSTIMSVAPDNGNINYESLSWFKYNGTDWEKLDTTINNEDHTYNTLATTHINGDGLYVLMAKAADVTAKPVNNLKYKNSIKTDGQIRLTFDDPNENVLFYHVYYDTDAVTTDSDYMTYRPNEYDSKEGLILNLHERNKNMKVAVEVVLKDGSKSPLSTIDVTTGAADSDQDGIPDWYCDEYNLWDNHYRDTDFDGIPDYAWEDAYYEELGITRTIADADDDEDGISNLEEFKNGTDPRNPEDPAKVTNIAVKSISLPETFTVDEGYTNTLTATLDPVDATNQTIIWKVEDESIATVTGNSINATVTGNKIGETKITATTDDGEYIASCTIIVQKHVEPTTSDDSNSSSSDSSSNNNSASNSDSSSNSSSNSSSSSSNNSSSSSNSNSNSSNSSSSSNNSSTNSNTSTSTSTTVDNTAPNTGDTTKVGGLFAAIIGALSLAVVSRKKNK